MYKKTINYTDFNGVDRKEDFYFNFMKAELVEMNMSTGGGLKSFIERITNTQDQIELIKLFKELVLKAYGIKSDDGKRFIKSQELRDAFEQTNAYNELFMMLATNEKEAVKFINGIMPADLVAEAQKEANALPSASTTPLT
jgi:hypothetical protein